MSESKRNRKCIFCANKADSQEHIWSQWILDLLPPGKDGQLRRMMADGSVKPLRMSKPVLTAGLVCERDCNNGWMSEKLEGPMRAATRDIIIHNTHKTLSPSQCRSIAAWSFKTMVLANHMNLRGESPYFSERQRYSFAKNLTMPKGVQVWMAKRDAGHLTATFKTTRRVMQPNISFSPHLLKPPVSRFRFEIFDCIFSVGFMLLHVIASRFTESETASVIDFPMVTQPLTYEDFAIPIWPNKGQSVHWPPQRSVGNESFEIFVERFNQFTDLPPWMNQ